MDSHNLSDGVLLKPVNPQVAIALCFPENKLLLVHFTSPKRGLLLPCIKFSSDRLLAAKSPFVASRRCQTALCQPHGGLSLPPLQQGGGPASGLPVQLADGSAVKCGRKFFNRPCLSDSPLAALETDNRGSDCRLHFFSLKPTHF